MPDLLMNSVFHKEIAMNFSGEAKRLESLDIALIAATIGCGEDHLHAVMEVEARGGGFDRHGRIKMLFEPHVFYRELGPGVKRDRAVAEGLAYRRWGQERYPTDSYPRLQRAMQIDSVAALRSCSWGLGQIMGFNARLAGFDSAQQMVEVFRDDEDTHLAAMVQFIVSTGLDDDLRRQDWRGFARGYNGSGYEKHGYHTKLQRAFEKWRAIPDTPFTAGDIDRAEFDPNPEPEPVAAVGQPTLQIGDRGVAVELLQAEMQGLRYFVGQVDGKFGPRTRGAVLAFQADSGLESDGVVGPRTWAAIRQAEPRPLRQVTEADLEDSGTLADTRRSDRLADVTAGTSAVAVIADAQEAVEDAQDAVAGVQEAADGLLGLWHMIQPYWPLALILVAFLVWRGMNASTRKRRVADAITGAHDGR